MKLTARENQFLEILALELAAMGATEVTDENLLEAAKKQTERISKIREDDEIMRTAMEHIGERIWKQAQANRRTHEKHRSG